MKGGNREEGRGKGGMVYLEESSMAALGAVEEIVRFAFFGLVGGGVGVGVGDLGGAAVAACVREVPVADEGGEVGG